MRWILTICLVTSTGFSGAASADEKESAAISAIEKAGGSVRKIAANSDDKEVEFYLSDKEISDDALKHVPDVANVIWLNLRGTKITDAGLEPIGGIKSLKKLHLEKTAIGDDGLKHLSGLQNLEYLNLYGTNVTDAGLEHLEPLKNLKKLYLWESKATEQGAKKLVESLPELKINLGEATVAKVEPKPAAPPQDESEAEKPKPAEPPKAKE